jgi:hypothetical protein
LKSLQFAIIKDESVTPSPDVRPDSGGRVYVVELHVEFEVVVTVAFTRAHSLQIPSVGVTGHIQLPVGQLAPGSVVLVLRMPVVISDSNRRTSSRMLLAAHGQFRTYQLGPAVVLS